MKMKFDLNIIYRNLIYGSRESFIINLDPIHYKEIFVDKYNEQKTLWDYYFYLFKFYGKCFKRTNIPFNNSKELIDEIIKNKKDRIIDFETRFYIYQNEKKENIGFIILNEENFSVGIAKYTIAVDPNFKGCKYGERILDNFLTNSFNKFKWIKQINAHVFSDNITSLKFHDRFKEKYKNKYKIIKTNLVQSNYLSMIYKITKKG